MEYSWLFQSAIKLLSMIQVSSPVKFGSPSTENPDCSRQSPRVSRFYKQFKKISSLIEEEEEDGITPLEINDHKIKELDTIFDVSMKKAKLKQIENNFEMQKELRTRRSKFSPQKHPYRHTKNNSFSLQKFTSVQAMFQSFKHNFFEASSRRPRFQSMNSIDLEQLKGTVEVRVNSRSKISFYQELKNHPQLLNYAKQKNEEKRLEKEKKLQEKQSSICAFNPREPNYMIPLKKHQSQTLDSPEPKVIVQDKRRKLFSKTAKKNFIFLESSPQISDFRKEQNKVYTNKVLRGLSQDSELKLREKLDKIALEIYECRKPFFKDSEQGQKLLRRRTSHLST